MTTGSYNRNLRVSTAGKYSGPYMAGVVQIKNWSGTNYPSGKPLRTNPFPAPVTRYVLKDVKRKVVVKRIHYVWKKVSSASQTPTTSLHARRSGRVNRLPTTRTSKRFRRRSSKKSFAARVYRVRPVVRVPKVATSSYTWVRAPVATSRVATVREKVLVRKDSYFSRPLASHFFRPPARGRLVDHDYSCSWTDQTDCVVNYTYSGVGNFSNVTSAITVAPTITQSWSSNDDLNLIGKIRERVAGSDFSAGVALAESHQSLKLITDAATRIYKGVGALQRGNLPEAIRQLTGHLSKKQLARKGRVKSTTIQDRWLELQYGWRPLLQDVYGGAQFLAHQLSVPIQQTLRVSRERKGAVVFNPGWHYRFGSALTRSSVKATIREKDIYQLSGLTDPASILWEKMPYSFVADWFIPIGSYLSARGLSQALTGTFVTSKLIRVELDGFTQDAAVPISGITYTGQTPKYHTGSFSRSVSTTLQIPLPSWKPLGQVASWQHCANAVALLTSRGAASSLSR